MNGKNCGCTRTVVDVVVTIDEELGGDVDVGASVVATGSEVVVVPGSSSVPVESPWGVADAVIVNGDAASVVAGWSLSASDTAINTITPPIARPPNASLNRTMSQVTERDLSQAVGTLQVSVTLVCVRGLGSYVR